MKLLKFTAWVVVTTFFTLAVNAEGTKLLRFPDIHEYGVVFSYAGNLYTASSDGGTAYKLTSHPALELFPRFSPDGKLIAFTGQYHGNSEVYIIPSKGGEPKRLTFTPTLNRDDVADRMGPNNIVMGFTPDGKEVIFRSRMNTFNDFKGSLFAVSVNGGIPRQLPLSYGSWISYAPDGKQFAYNRVFREFRTWKYYRGGMADEIWLHDPASGTTQNLTNNNAQDVFPMWAGDKIFFASDRNRTMNLFAYDLKTKQVEQKTQFNDYDIKFPETDGKRIIFEHKGELAYYDIESGNVTELMIIVPDDLFEPKPLIDASKFIGDVDIAPDGARMVASARGDIFTLPVTSGLTRNLTRTSGAHDRYVTWAPNGEYVAFVSDSSGEDEIYIATANASAPPKQLTKTGAPYKYQPSWSPNSKFIVYADRSQKLFLLDVATKKVTEIAYNPDWEIRSYSWSPDSRFIAFVKTSRTDGSTIWVYDLTTKQSKPVTDEFYSSYSPVFSPDGKYLYLVSMRTFNPIYSNTEWNHAYTDMSKIYLIPLAKGTPSPFLPENKEAEIVKPTAPQKDDKGKGKTKGASETKTPEVTVTIDFEGIADRLIELPLPAGNYFNLQAVANKLYYGFSAMGSKPTYKFFDLEKKKETEIGSFGLFSISANHKKVLVSEMGKYFIEDLPSGSLKPSNAVETSNMTITIDQQAEYLQIFNEAHRQMRDFFYDPNMHGVNWNAIKEKYLPLAEAATNRNDLTYVIGEMIGELNAGHAYVGGGDRPKTERIKLGLLGANFEKDASGYFKFTKIYKGESWNPENKSPLNQPGISVSEGQYLLAINGIDLKPYQNPNELLVGLAGKKTEITVGASPKTEGSKNYIIEPIDDISALTYHEWVEKNRKYVEEKTGGKVGYLHIPNMVTEGLNAFARYYYAQLNKQALIIDDRGNGGGNVSPMIIERLRREVALQAIARNGVPTTKPGELIDGPKICLIDQYSASDGDLFPYQFRFYKLGTIIGQRSWGGVVGIRGSLPFIDGGSLNKPEFSHYAADGSDWIIEGYGVDPDIEVVNDPYLEYKGTDAQLDKAIDEITKKLNQTKPRNNKIPTYPNKSR